MTYVDKDARRCEPVPEETYADFNDRVGLLIRTMRRERGISGTDLAKAIDVGRDNIWAWEQGKRSIKAYDLVRVAAALGVRVCDILGVQ